MSIIERPLRVGSAYSAGIAKQPNMGVAVIFALVFLAFPIKLKKYFL